MRKKLQSIGAFLMTCMVLVSSTGFTINGHLCKGALQSIALFAQAQVCEHALPQASTSDTCSIEFKNRQHQKDCCSEIALSVPAKEKYPPTLSSVKVPFSQVFIGGFYTNTFNTFANKLQYLQAKRYLPPLIGPVIFLWVQSFLL
ncbi:hypothetical protein AAG747_17260 [Rapidithrix thailandica]|uniref:Uncharacterized protein n=1 Tax=Rapidithrix thailandica TaxID=413964 RepID=A0AAW9SB10_9BACT